MREGLPRDIRALRAGLADDDAWSQEYELQWLDEASAWLPYDLISVAEHAEAGDPTRYGGGASYVGMDIGRRRDLTVIWVCEQVGDVLWTREVRVMRRASFASQESALADVMLRYWPVRTAIDQTGLGEAPVEAAQRRYGENRVEGVTFTLASKQDMAVRVKQVMEDRRLRLPMGDAAMRADLYSLRKLSMPGGGVRFVGGEGADGHADRAWALMLALRAGAVPGEEFGYHGVPRRPMRTDRIRRVKVTAGFARGAL